MSWRCPLRARVTLNLNKPADVPTKGTSRASAQSDTHNYPISNNASQPLKYSYLLLPRVQNRDEIAWKRYQKCEGCQGPSYEITCVLGYKVLAES